MQRLASVISATLFAVACAGWASPSDAAGFPQRQVTIVVPYSPGGVTDRYARIVAAKLTETWGQTVIVDNKAGGGTIIGTQFASAAPPDGHTILLTSYGFTSNPVLRKSLPYDPASLAPLMLLGSSSNLLVLTGTSPMKTLADVVRHARSAPGALKLASSGNASSPHIAAELFAKAVDAEITHLPYKGTGPAMNDVIGGQVDGIFDGPSAMPNVQAGKLRAIAITAEERHPAAPDVPTFRELGIDLVFGSWFGFLVPTGTPPDVRKTIHRALSDAVADPAVRAQIDKTGIRVKAGSPEAFGEFLAQESKRLEQLIASGAKIIVQ